MSVFNAIICSVNLTEHYDDIIYYTQEVAKLTNAKIILVHSLPKNDAVFALTSRTGGSDVIFNNAKNAALEFLDEIIEKHFKGLEVEKVISEGSAANDLLGLLEVHCADLVIMGSYSTKGFRHFLDANSSQFIINGTRIPVLVVPNELSLECLPDF